MNMALRSYKTQNGPRTKYCLEPFCGLDKPNFILVRYVAEFWNQVVGSLTKMGAQLTKFDLEHIHNRNIPGPDVSEYVIT